MKLIADETEGGKTTKVRTYDVSMANTVAIHHHLSSSTSLEFSVRLGQVHVMIGSAENFGKFAAFLHALRDPFRRQRYNSFYEENLAVKIKYTARIKYSKEPTGYLPGEYWIEYGCIRWPISEEEFHEALDDIDAVFDDCDRINAAHVELLRNNSEVSGLITKSKNE